MVEAALLYRRLVGAQLRSQLQYRASFLLDVAGSFLIALVDFAEVAIVFTHLPLLKGWSFAEVLFLYGVSAIAFGLTDAFIGHLDKLPLKIRDGSFDAVLIRPLGSLFQSLAAEVQFRKIGRIVQGAVVLTLAIHRLHLHWTLAKVVWTVVMTVSASVIFGSVWVLGAASTFWTIDTMEVTNSFTYGGNVLTSYPMTIYGPWLRRLVGFGLGLAFVTYFPSLFILGKKDQLGLPSVLRFCCPFVAVIGCAVAGTVWSFAVRHYRSTGS